MFTSARRVRFREMEYAIPLEAIPEAVREVRALIERKGWRITFPIEVRAAASDDNWLSTAYGRETGYIAVHRYFREDPTEYFTRRRADHAELRRPAALGQDAHADGRDPARRVPAVRRLPARARRARPRAPVREPVPRSGARRRARSASGCRRGAAVHVPRDAARDAYGVRRRSVIDPSTIEPTIHAHDHEELHRDPLGVLVAGRDRVERVDRVGQREPLADRLEPGGQLVGRQEDAAEQHLREDEHGQELHDLELGARERAREQAERRAEQGVADRDGEQQPDASPRSRGRTPTPRTRRRSRSGRSRGSRTRARSRG